MPSNSLGYQKVLFYFYFLSQLGMGMQLSCTELVSMYKRKELVTLNIQKDNILRELTSTGVMAQWFVCLFYLKTSINALRVFF